VLEEFDDSTLLGLGPEGGYKNMRLFEIGGDIYGTNRD
jgi:hypothetical protein